MRRIVAPFAFGLALAACVGTTGGTTVDFPAVASGPSDAVAGQPLVFTNDAGWTVTLTKATLHVGAVYLDRSEAISGAGDTPCILPGTYDAQVTTGMDVDLLSPARQPFPAAGHGVTGPALVGQVWLTGGDVNDGDDRTTILDVEGTAQSGGDVRPFAGTITIGTNRLASGSVAGASPPCKQRIVVVRSASVDVETSGGLLLQIDPRLLFVNVEFGYLAKSATTGVYTFADDSSDPASAELYDDLHSSGALYTFAWVRDL